MKLRRALASVATTAAIVPAALMAAPGAFADESASPVPSASPTPSTLMSAPPAPSAPSAPKVSAPPAPKPSSKPSAPATDPWSTDCTKADVDAGSVIQMSLSGLPSEITAGSGWHQFTLTAVNPTKQSLGQVRWIAGFDNDDDTLLKHAHIEYFNGKTWVDLEQEIGGTGVLFGETKLGALQKVDVQLRVRIDAKASAGLSGAVGVGAYIDTTKNCAHHTFTVYQFKVLAPSSKAVHPAPAKPDPSVKPLMQIKTPVGGPAELPATAAAAHTNTSASSSATGALAHTGASSQMPVIAGLGGAAIVAGAGAMFVVRRRKAGSDA